MSKEVDIVEVKSVRKLLQQFNEDLGMHDNSVQRHKLGRVLTIIDAAIADPEQRKAIKDLVNNEWWGNNNMPSETPMVNPHTDIRGICTVLGFELYPETEGNIVKSNSGLDDYQQEWAVKRYTDILSTRK